MTAPARTTPVLAVLLLLLVSGCTGSGATHAKATSSGAQQRINDGGSADARSRSTVDVTATNFRFSPSTIVATPGETVTLVVHNTSQTPHNVTASGVNEDLAPGSVHRVTLTVPASGELVFVCEYHKASGMAGQVGPAAAPSSAGTPSAPSSGGAGGDTRY